jgi:nucleoside-diphosphate-sugar epimerase
MKLMILGAGFSGKAIAENCKRLFETVYGTTRSEAKFSDVARTGAVPLAFDGQTLTPEMTAALAETTHILQSISPDEDGDGVLNRLPNLRELAPKLKWIGYLSTIGVYGNRDGNWVDESAELEPVSERSRERVIAERQWLDLGTQMDIPAAVLRLSGIYGPGRNAFVNLDNGTARRLIKQGQIFNRIRVEDIGRFTAFLIERGQGTMSPMPSRPPLRTWWNMLPSRWVCLFRPTWLSRRRNCLPWRALSTVKASGFRTPSRVLLGLSICTQTTEFRLIRCGTIRPGGRFEDAILASCQI